MANPQVSFDKAFAIAATVAVAAGVVAGFWVLGTPGRQRAVAADRQRLRDLQSIAFDLHMRSQNQPDEFQLPAQLDPSQMREDPLTNEPYEYQRLSESRFELCAEFDTDSSSYPLQNATQSAEFWQHPEGRHCFELDTNQQPPSL